MNQLQVIKPELYFIYDEWAEDFKISLINTYIEVCENPYHCFYGPLPELEDIASESYEWLYKVCSFEEFGDPLFYEGLILDEDGKEDFYNSCYEDGETDFRQDVYTILNMQLFSFSTEDGRFHNMPFKEVW